MKRVHVLIKGMVQGVGFRSFVRRNARNLGVKGFVRNLPDGFTVEVVAEGDDDSIEQLIGIIRKGPPGAIVEDMEVEYEEPKNEFNDFEILY
ncbi:acylphosphatase [Vulcanisaeta souniana]|uniref:acylphosphatase n=1 Tax=Vulcanisaeta souniana JCM 11219 TaxID=1293586 RepID=A0A830EFN5_9CREN|nr:acylphosphatase [Vulcanisaeta souniana]BDR91315.1 acylphosphatase [Vulcanisaeta souniana JCM 11219]GGI72268.1 acylphosphatase [Vulcanisaeta souniana JCM 11219]